MVKDKCVKPKYLSPENFLVIQGWMVTELELKGNELLIYALIYGFSQAGETWFTGTLKYIAEWTNSTVRGVQKSIASLIEKKLITKEENSNKGVKSCQYRVWNKVHGGMEQSSPNNIINNNIYNTPYTHYSTTLRNECSPQGDPHQNGIGENGGAEKEKEFIPPTLDEVTAYCAKRGNKVDPKRFFDYYDASGWIDSKGDKVKNWKQKCISWERSNNTVPAKQSESPSSFDTDEFFEAALRRSYEEMEKYNKTQGDGT